MMKLYTVVVYNLRMCMKEDHPGLNKAREIIISFKANFFSKSLPWTIFIGKKTFDLQRTYHWSCSNNVTNNLVTEQNNYVMHRFLDLQTLHIFCRIFKGHIWSLFTRLEILELRGQHVMMKSQLPQPLLSAPSGHMGDGDTNTELHIMNLQV